MKCFLLPLLAVSGGLLLAACLTAEDEALRDYRLFQARPLTAEQQQAVNEFRQEFAGGTAEQRQEFCDFVVKYFPFIKGDPANLSDKDVAFVVGSVGEQLEGAIGAADCSRGH